MKPLIPLFFLILSNSLFSQQWSWAAKANSTTGGQAALKITCDNTGNVFMLGNNLAKATYGTVLLDSGAFVVRYDPLGNLSWAKHLDGTPTSITCDKSGNLYVTGSFSGTVSIAPYNFTSAGGTDIFVTKLSSFGNTIWARHFGTANSETSNCVAVDDNFNCYVTGYYKDSIFFDTKLLKDSTGYYWNDFFLAKLDPYGNANWATSGPNNYGSANAYYYNGTCIRIAKDQNVSVACEGNNIYSPYSMIGYFKYTPAGGIILHKQSWSCFSARDFAIDDSANVYHINNSSTHYYYTPDLQRFDSQVNYQWEKKVSDGGYYPNFLLDRGLSTDDTGNVFLSGALGGAYMSGNTCTVYTTPMTRKGGTDIMLGKFNKTGNCKWLKTAGGVNNEGASDMCVDAFGNCYVLGEYNYLGKSASSDTLTFDNYKLTNDGNWRQLFVAKLSPGKLMTDLPLVYEVSRGFKLFPNPSGGLFKISLENFPKAKLMICDALGKCVFRKDCNDEDEISINLSNQPKGIYFIELLSGNMKDVQKVIID